MRLAQTLFDDDSFDFFDCVAPEFVAGIRMLRTREMIVRGFSVSPLLYQQEIGCVKSCLRLMEYAKAVGVSFTLVGQLLAFLFSTEALPMSLQNIWLDLIVPFEQSPLSGDALAQAVVCFLETQFKRRLESDLISLGTTIIKRLIDVSGLRGKLTIHSIHSAFLLSVINFMFSANCSLFLGAVLRNFNRLSLQQHEISIRVLAF